MFGAPATNVIPIYINILPRYSGFRVNAYGPVVQRAGAPTFRVLVFPPAYDTAQILIASPKINNNKPKRQCGLCSNAKYMIRIAIGIGV